MELHFKLIVCLLQFTHFYYNDPLVPLTEQFKIIYASFHLAPHALVIV